MGDTLVEKLGYAPDARLVIFHADDVGMCHGSNQAFLELSQAGILKSGSIMAPCPWVPEVLRMCRERPEIDVGVHLTLTSEWRDYRWGALTTREPRSGLLAEDGTLWAGVAEVAEHADADYAAVELRAQVERVVGAGVEITHIDTHMGTALLPQMLPIYVQLGADYQVPAFFARSEEAHGRRDSDEGADAVAKAVALFAAQSLPVLDHIRVTPCYSGRPPAAPSPEAYEAVLAGLPPGITHFALHPNAPGDIEAIDRLNAAWRIFEYEYFQSPRLREFLAREGIVSIGYREVREVLRRGQA
jgi:hypothetical protein